MSTTYFGFALADGMFAGDVTITRKTLTVEAVKEILLGGVVPCLNPSHEATISAMRVRFGIDVPIPEKPPQVSLVAGDSIVVMGVRGLPRLTDRHEYTVDEVAKATFSFSVYRVGPTRREVCLDELKAKWPTWPQDEFGGGQLWDDITKI